MKQRAIVEILKTSIKSNLWAQRWSILLFLMVCIVAYIAQFDIIQFFELLLGFMLFIGIFFFGFVGIALHTKYYFRYERNRKIKLCEDFLKVIINGQVINQIIKTEITKIVLCDNLKSDSFNLFPTIVDSYYYLIIIGENWEQIVLTSLLDVNLKRKIIQWYGQKLEHRYQFFPFP